MNRTDIRFLGLEVYVYDSSLDVELPMPTNVVRNVDWGDGTIDSFAIGTSATHTYTTTEPTTFRLKIYPNADGTLPLFNGSHRYDVPNPTQEVENLCLNVKKVYNCNAPFSNSNWDFRYMDNCTYVDWRMLSYTDTFPADPFYNTDIIANQLPPNALEHLRGELRYIFYNKSNLTGNFPTIPYGATNISGLFCNTGYSGNVSSIPSTVTSMAGTFSGTGITNIPSFPPNVQDISSCYEYCGRLNGQTVPDIPNSVVYMGSCFNTTGITGSVKFSSNAISIAYTYFGCSGLSGSVPSIPNTVTDMYGAFGGCTGLTGSVPSIPSACSSIQSAFADCTGFTGSIPTIPNAVSDMSYAFANCTGLTGSTPALHFGILYHNGCFYGCTGLDGTIGTIDTRISGEFYQTFYNCSNLTGNAPALWDTTLYPNVTQPDPGNSNQCFYGCTSLSNYNDIPAEWK